MFGLSGMTITPRALGRLEFLFRPRLRNGLGGVFNAQCFRETMFRQIIGAFPINAIIETGSYRGSTTALFARTGLPVYSIEADERFFAYTQCRFFFQRRRVRILCGDSRALLKSLCADDAVPKRDVFFYLDAHWKDDLPLDEEINLIFAHWENAIVMVDDFCVPGTTYGYDSYGSGKTLDLDYLRETIIQRQLSVFFPAADAESETGARRGSVVLCREAHVAEGLARLSSLRRHASSV